MSRLRAAAPVTRADAAWRSIRAAAVDAQVAGTGLASRDAARARSALDVGTGVCGDLREKPFANVPLVARAVRDTER